MATDFFIKVDGIDGQSNDKNHGKWIEVRAFNHGAVQNVGAGRATDVSGRGQFEPFVFEHELDKATPKLQQFCMNGQKVAKVEFQVCRAVAGVQTPVYEVTMENVKIAKTEVAIKEVEGGQIPVETVSLVPGKLTWKYTAIKPDNSKDGAVETSFNQVENA